MDQFVTIMHSLLAYLYGRARPMHTVANPFLESVRIRIIELHRRLNALVVKWRAGKLPLPCKPRPGRARTQNPDRPKFPTKHGWLRAYTDLLIVNHVLTIEAHVHHNAEFARFLAEVPQAGRILRPLYHMLGIETPASIRRDPPPRKPRAPKPRKPRFQRPEPHQSTSPLHLRLEVPGIPNRRPRRKLAV